MPRTGLTAGQLRAKAVESTIHQIRRHGFEKVRLVDVAKEVGVTHAALYGHFKDKSALLDAVSEKWLNSLEEKLLQVCQKEKDPIARIQEWFFRLHELKRQKVTNEPELYKAFDFAAKMKKSFYK